MKSVYDQLLSWKLENEKDFSHLDPKTRAEKFITKELFFDWSVNIHGILGLAKVAIIH
jgi:hypothetical protein